jgi:hypothetical protein
METIKQIADFKVKNLNTELKNTKIIACNMYYFNGSRPGAYCELYNKSNKKRIKINLMTEINLTELINNLKN